MYKLTTTCEKAKNIAYLFLKISPYLDISDNH